MELGTLVDGRFRVVEKIGRGGLGVVWGAIREEDGQLVAIKVLREVDEDATRRFHLEARAMGALRHRNCVEVLEIGEADGSPFIVMEWLRGVSMATLRGQRLPIDRVKGLMAQVFMAVTHAHQVGITHRDLKPENIILCDGPNGEEVKVIDFGLVKLAYGGNTRLTSTGDFLGTPQYMSPEQARGERSIGPPTDVYACGVMLFELLSGRLPFSGSLLELGLAHVQSPPPPIDRADCPDELRRLVEACLSKAPAQRPSARAALGVLIGSEVGAQSRSVVRRPNASRTHAVWALGALGALVVAGWLLYPSADENVPTVRRDRVDDASALLKTAPAVAPAKPATTKVEELAATWEKSPLDYTGWLIRVPKGYDDDRPSSLIVLLPHDNVDVAHLAAISRFDAIADRNNVVMVGTESKPSPWQPADAWDDQIRRVVEATAEELSIDRSRVFVVGFGTGGGPALSLRCEPWIGAVAVASYLSRAGEFNDCDSPRPEIVLLPTSTGHLPVDGGLRCRQRQLKAFGLQPVPAMSHAAYFDAIRQGHTGCAAPTTRARGRRMRTDGGSLIATSNPRTSSSANRPTGPSV